MRYRWILVGAVALCGCSDDVDRLGRIFQKSASKIESATEPMRDRLHSGRDPLRSSDAEPSLETRVTLRMRWDADMAGVEVQAHLIGPGTIELTGTVGELAQQRRAVELAQTTLGVEKVLDRTALAVGEDKP